MLLGNIQAVALRDIFVQAQNRDSSPPSLQIEEPEWEKRRSINLSELIDVYRWAGSGPVTVGPEITCAQSVSVYWGQGTCGQKFWGVEGRRCWLLDATF